MFCANSLLKIDVLLAVRNFQVHITLLHTVNTCELKSCFFTDNGNETDNGEYDYDSIADIGGRTDEITAQGIMNHEFFKNK